VRSTRWQPLGYVLWALLIAGVLSILVFLGRDLLASPKLNRVIVVTPPRTTSSSSNLIAAS
jgi:uncharacterized membrane protein YagU involved in acid resistance